MSFYRERSIARTRKPHGCVGCRHPIEVGGPALYIATHNWACDQPFFGHFHPECRAAECALNELHKCYSEEDWLSLSDIDDEDRAWLRDQHPVAAGYLFGPVA